MHSKIEDFLLYLDYGKNGKNSQKITLKLIQYLRCYGSNYCNKFRIEQKFLVTKFWKKN